MRQTLWKIIRKTYLVEFPCKKLLQLQEYSLQRTTGVKIAQQIYSGSAQKGNVNYKNSLRNCRFFSNATAMQSRISGKKISGDVGKTAVKKVLKNYQKNVFISVPFKKFELSNQPTYNYAKTDSAAKISFVCFENFKIGLWWNHI